MFIQLVVVRAVRAAVAAAITMRNSASQIFCFFMFLMFVVKGRPTARASRPIYSEITIFGVIVSTATTVVITASGVSTLVLTAIAALA